MSTPPTQKKPERKRLKTVGAALLTGIAGTTAWFTLRSEEGARPAGVRPMGDSAHTIVGAYDLEPPAGVQLPNQRQETRTSAESVSDPDAAPTGQDTLLQFSSDHFRSHHFETREQDGKRVLTATPLTVKDTIIRVNIADPLYASDPSKRVDLDEKRTDAYAVFTQSRALDVRNTVEKHTVPAYSVPNDAVVASMDLPHPNGRLISQVTLTAQEADNLRTALTFDGSKLRADIEQSLHDAPTHYQDAIDEMIERRGELDLNFLKLLFLLPPNHMAKDDLMKPFEAALAQGDYGAAEYILQNRALPLKTMPVRDAIPAALIDALWNKGRYDQNSSLPAAPPGLGDSGSVIAFLQLNRSAVSFKIFSHLANGNDLDTTNAADLPEEIRALLNHPWVKQACADIYTACGMAAGNQGEAQYKGLLDITPGQLATLKKLARQDPTLPMSPNGRADPTAVLRRLEDEVPKMDLSVTHRQELDFLQRHAGAFLGANGLVLDATTHNLLATLGLIEGLNRLDTLRPAPTSQILQDNALRFDTSQGGLPALGNLVRAGALNYGDLLSTEPPSLALARLEALSIPFLQASAAELIPARQIEPAAPPTKTFEGVGISSLSAAGPNAERALRSASTSGPSPGR